MRALRVGIFTDKGIGNCSNHGISERFDHVLLLHDEGNVDVDMNDPPENLCKAVRRIICGREYIHIEPVARPTGAGWMSGGCLCYTCDSRFMDISRYALSLHDRQETWEQYEANSH